MSLESPLIQVSQAVASGAAVVFDLDSTLFCVSPRTQAILRQLAGEAHFRDKYVQAAEVLEDLVVLPSDWGIRSALERTPLAFTEELIREVRDYWRKHFFSDYHLDKDHIYPQANEYVQHLAALGAEIFYLTGRNEGLMRKGSLQALAKWGFPLASEAHLIMKPSDVMTDEGFKAEVLHAMMGQHPQIWFFENEPLIIELVRERVPAVRIVYVHSVHSGRANPPADLPRLPASYAGPWR